MLNSSLMLKDVEILSKILNKEIFINDLDDDVKKRIISLCKKQLEEIKEKNRIKSNQIVLLDDLLNQLKM